MNFKKVALTSAVILMGIGLTACSNNSNSKNDSSNSTKTTQKAKSNSSNDTEKRISQNKELRNKFDKIQVGDLMKKGEGGSSEAEVKKLLGTPNSTDSNKTDGVKTSGATWTDKGVTITVAYVNHKAISKLITGFKWESRPEKLTLKSYDSIKDGSSYEAVVKKYGEPDGLDESLIMGEKSVTATWLTGVKGDTGANVALTFTNNKLTSKTQTDLK